MEKQNKKIFRSIWISDVHLGTRSSNSEELYKFLSNVESKYLYLVGDILDLWNIKKWHWPQIQNNVLRKLLKGTVAKEIIYLPGNHDEFFKEFEGISIGNILIKNEIIHVTKNGSRFSVFHGDEFDFVMKNQKWLAYSGSIAYNWLMIFNSVVSFTRRKFGITSRWSFAEYVKKNVKNVVNHIGNFEQVVANKAKELNLDGVVCGHLHTPSIKKIDNVYYLNSGDWVENLTAIVETIDGDIELITIKNGEFKTLIKLKDL